MPEGEVATQGIIKGVWPDGPFLGSLTLKWTYDYGDKEEIEMTEPEATDRLILDLREYEEGEDRGRAVEGSIPTKPIPLLALIAHIKRMAAIRGWRLMDAQEKRLERPKRDEHGRFKKREE